MSDVKIIFDNKDSLARLRATQLFVQGDSKTMLECAQYGVTQIKIRTAAGKDHNKQMFKPYAESTKIFRAATGHPVSKVNLFFTGKMMAAMHGKVINPKESRIMFASPEETEKANKNQETRQFFGFNNDDSAGMTRIFNANLEKAMR